MPNQTSLIHRFLSLFSRRSRALRDKRFEAVIKSENTFVQRPPLYELQNIPTEVIVPKRQPVVLVQIERRKTAGNPNG
jgi:hypothetical protein